MPFKSKAQQKFLFAKHPEIAKRWAKHTPDIKHLPEHAKAKQRPREKRGALLETLDRMV